MPRGLHATPEEDRRRRDAIHDNGGNIRAAARQLGIPTSSLYAFARHRGIRGMGDGGQPLPLDETVRRVRAWLEHGSDRAAAKSLNMKRFTYTRWRYRQLLPCRSGIGRPKVKRL